MTDNQHLHFLRKPTKVENDSEDWPLSKIVLFFAFTSPFAILLIAIDQFFR